jgi:xanthine dehydrogenase accessory factor
MFGMRRETMDEGLFSRLAARLQGEAVVLASVHDTRGATPRKRGSRMLITAQATEFSIGGGAAEARVIDAAQALLREGGLSLEVQIDLSGRTGSSGVCGGAMRLTLRRWNGDVDRVRAEHLAAELGQGRAITVTGSDTGDAPDVRARLEPDPRLLIVGAGHCGQALCELARHLAFDRWVFDERATALEGADYAGATRRSGEPALLADAFASDREVYAVLLNRGYASDVATLRVLAGRKLAYLGMMGSRKRIAEVLDALDSGARADLEPRLHAPIGLDIGAHTPHEIAVSILAQIVQVRSAAENRAR